jgi:ribosomal protein S18 acetylase RimI-like enzyme
VADPHPRGPRESEVTVSAIERRIQAALLDGASRWREVERVGPFTATFARGSSHPSLNYAVPDEGAEPSHRAVEALLRAFGRRGLVARLEYLPSLAPKVAGALLAAGFSVETRAPLLVLGEVTAAGVPGGIELVEVASDDDMRAAAAAQHEAYGEPEPPSEGWLDGVRRSIAAGGLLVLARETSTGEAAGGGQCTPPQRGATELTSVGVRPAFRRRGIAAAMTAWLAGRMRARGTDLVFLTAAGDAEARIYARVGFERVGEALYVSLPAGEDASRR